MATQLPAGQYQNRTKQMTLTYDSVSLQAVVPVGGSVSGLIDVDSWTQFALQSVPNGTILGGTTVNFWGASNQQGPFYPLYGTSGNTQATLQIGSTTNGIYGPITVFQPVRYLQLVLGGTQSAAQTFYILAK